MSSGPRSVHRARIRWLLLGVFVAALALPLVALAGVADSPPLATARAPAAGEKMLVASDGATNDAFGYSVGVSGDVIIAGAYAHMVGGNSEQGAAYLYARGQGGAGNWGQLKILTTTDGVAGDHFGKAVALGADLALVGAPDATTGGCCGQGAAYLFARNQGGAGNWGTLKKLVAPDAQPSDQFGISVAIDGGVVVVGAQLHKVGANDSQGAVYVFARDQGGAGNWGFVKQLTASNGETNDWFGAAVAVSGDTIVVGVNKLQGAAYVYARNQGGAENWGEVKMLAASDPEVGDGFGTAVGVYSGTAVVGAWLHTVVSGTEGTVYVFERDQGGAANWGESRRIVAADGAVDDNLGAAVAISGDRITAGASYDDSTAVDEGSVYVFERNRGGANQWGQAAKLTAAGSGAGDRLGGAAGLSGGTVVGGAWLRDMNTVSDQGAAFVWEMGGQRLYLPTILR